MHLVTTKLALLTLIFVISYSYKVKNSRSTAKTTFGCISSTLNSGPTKRSFLPIILTLSSLPVHRLVNPVITGGMLSGGLHAITGL